MVTYIYIQWKRTSTSKTLKEHQSTRKLCVVRLPFSFSDPVSMTRYLHPLCNICFCRKCLPLYSFGTVQRSCGFKSYCASFPLHVWCCYEGMPIICLQAVCKVHSNAQLGGEGGGGGSSRFGGFVVLSYSHQSPLFWVMVIPIHTAHTHTDR